MQNGGRNLALITCNLFLKSKQKFICVESNLKADNIYKVIVSSTFNKPLITTVSSGKRISQY